MANNVIKISQISPSTKLVDPLILPLTFFDLMWLKEDPTNRVNFYKLTESSSDTFYSEILPKLEQSLSLVLTHFLPLSGHLKWEPKDLKPHIVVLPQDVVTLTVAETDADFSRVTSKGLRHQTELRALVSELPVSSDSASILTLANHFFPEARLLHRNHNPPCCYGRQNRDRTVINLPTELESKIFEFPPYLSEEKANVRTLKVPPTKEIKDLVRITLEMTQENVEKLRERAKSHESTLSDDLHLSTFVITYAYVLTCMVKARGDDEDRLVPFTYVADFRERLDPPVPVTYFGNCVLPINLNRDKAETFLGEDGFVNAVKILSDSVRGLKAESIWKLYEAGLKKMELGLQKLSVTGSTKFGMYGSDFGWGKPVSTDNVSISQELLFSMSERRDETGGVEIGMCLKKSEMDVFVSLFRNGLEN
ncbi:unnamed protein product [Microthlaspi erraticum]|uniref:BAHD acyltransferase n=1 Tax=Microthlaspi erraticum TaxID=1685480 RepID=A0A6D2L794_9BRAS|nr:unnamed protein product [Microthlaspi erraticum]